ncbi:MAG: Fur family transcriptional regulator [Nitrospirales bacterium]
MKVSRIQKTYKEALQAAGYRFTRPRQAVLQVLQRADHPLSALEVFRRLQEDHVSIDQVTVYRSLAVLSRLGLVAQLAFAQEGQFRYEWRDGRALSHHVRCQKCGRIESLCLPSLKRLKFLITRKTSFLVNDQSLEFNGLCPDCR